MKKLFALMLAMLLLLAGCSSVPMKDVLDGFADAGITFPDYDAESTKIMHYHYRGKATIEKQMDYNLNTAFGRSVPENGHIFIVDASLYYLFDEKAEYVASWNVNRLINSSNISDLKQGVALASLGVCSAGAPVKETAKDNTWHRLTVEQVDYLIK